MFRKIIMYALFCLIPFFAWNPADGQGAEPIKLHLSIAAGLKAPMDQVIAKFSKTTGVEVMANYSHSGGLYTQIVKGHPCDLFFSAGYKYIEKLAEEGRLVNGRKFMSDDLVLVVSRTGHGKVSSVRDLAKDGVVAAIADLGAPVGEYSAAGLKRLGLWEEMNRKGNVKARPSSVQQAALMVKADQVDASLIYKSVAISTGLGVVETLSQEVTGEIIFGVGIIKGGQEALAGKFLDFARQNIDEFTKLGWRVYD